MNRRRSLLLAFALALAPLAGCTAPGDGGPTGDIPFETIERGSNSGIEEEEKIVVRDDEAWQQLWQRHAPDEEPPEVDFEEKMAVGIFKGQSPDGCHGAEVENVTGEEGEIVVEGAYFEVTDAYCTQQVTYPFHIVAFESHDAPVTFDIAEETRQQDGGDGSEDNGTDDGGADSGGSYTCREPSQGENSSLTETDEVGFETIEDGSQSQIQEACVTVARNETAWRDLWRDHHGASYADEDRPEVDFEQHVVVAIFKGESADACHGAEIENVTRDGIDRVVHGVFAEIEGTSCAQVVTQPFHIAKTERPEGEVRFDVREETRQG